MKTDDDILDRLVAFAESHARRVLLKEQHRELVPAFVTMAKDRKAMDIVATPWGNDREKQIALAIIRAKLRTEKCAAYSFVGEAWVSRYEVNEVDPDTDDWPEQRPAKRPNRVEVVSIFASTRTKQRMLALEMIRDKSGALTELKTFEPLRPGERGAEKLTGVFPSLFD